MGFLLVKRVGLKKSSTLIDGDTQKWRKEKEKKKEEGEAIELGEKRKGRKSKRSLARTSLNF